MPATFPLQQAIDAIERDTNWVSSLERRKREEIELSNRQHGQTRHEPTDNAKFYSAVHRSNQYQWDWIATHARDRVFIDVGCGNGSGALHAARNGAALAIGLDISDMSVQTGRALSEGLDNCRFIQADCENTRLPDASIDIMLCSGMLHHIDLTYAFPEFRRILKPGGKILGVEALNYNPAIKLYRKLTPELRSAWEAEHILSLKDLDFAKHFFDVSDVRYWHVVGYMSGLFPRLFPLLDAMDTVLERVPLINLMAWQFSFVLTKR